MQLVVSATPGTGKSTITKDAEKFGLNHCHVHYDNHTREYELTVPHSPLVPVFDSDSSVFDKSEFPGNYIKHIKEVLSKFPNVVIFVSSHENVREAMAEAGIEYVLVYPERELKGDYLERYKERGSPEKFIALMDEKWNDFIDSVQDDPAERHLVLSEGEFLVDAIKSDLENVVESKVDSIFPTAIINGTESIGDVVCDDVGQPVAVWGGTGLEPLPEETPPPEDPAVVVDPVLATAIVTGTESLGDSLYNDVGVEVGRMGEDGPVALEVIPAAVIGNVLEDSVPTNDIPPTTVDTPAGSVPENFQAADAPAIEAGQPAVDAPVVQAPATEVEVVADPGAGTTTVEVEVGGQENLLNGSERGDEVLPGSAPGPVSTELNKMDDVNLDQNQAVIGRDIGNAGNADEHPNVDGQENLDTIAEDGAEVLPGAAAAPVPAALKEMDKADLQQNLHEVEADIGTISKALEDRQDPERAGLEGLITDVSAFGPACADLKKRYGVDVEPSISGLESFLDQLKNMATVIKRAISDPKSDQAVVKKALFELHSAVKTYNSPAWVNKQQWINVGKVNVQVPAFLSEVNSPEDVGTAIALVIKRMLQTYEKQTKNELARYRAAIKIFNETKTWNPEEKTAADLGKLLGSIPAVITGSLGDSGLEELNVSMSGRDLPAIPKTNVSKITDLMMKIQEASTALYKLEVPLENCLNHDQWSKSKFLAKVAGSEQGRQLLDIISDEGAEPEFTKVDKAFYGKFLNVAKFLEMWLLRSTK